MGSVVRRRRCSSTGANPVRDSIRVIDDFCPQVDRVVQSVRNAGFGTLRPNKGEIGSSVYEGMGFVGDHAFMLASLNVVEGTTVLPNSMFFRVTRPGMERAYIHSDRESGSRTCVVYLSVHEEQWGTATYRHKASGLTRMPTFEEMRSEYFETLKADMVSADESAWEPTGFLGGAYNRAVIMDAPLFHSRIPLEGIGTTDENSRLVWVCHYYTPFTLPKEA